MQSLESRGVIKAMEFNSFTRVHHGDTEIKVSIGHIWRFQPLSTESAGVDCPRESWRENWRDRIQTQNTS